MLNATALPREEVRPWRTALDSGPWALARGKTGDSSALDSGPWAVARGKTGDNPTLSAPSSGAVRSEKSEPSSAVPLAPAPAHAPADPPALTDAPARPRGFTLRDIPNLEATWRRTGRTPTLRAKRLMIIPALELPSGLHMLLTLNGRKLRLLRPGLNVFTPALLQLPGDRLRFEFYPGEVGRRSDLTPGPSPRRGEGSGGPRHSCLLANSGARAKDEVPTTTDFYFALFGPGAGQTVVPPAPFATLTRFQRAQRGLLSRLITRMTDGK